MEHDGGPEASVLSLLAHIKQLAKAHGWLGEDTWQALGEDDGLRCTLLRGSVHLVAQILTSRQQLTRTQQRWLDALERTGVEIHVWKPTDREAIQHRLSRKETA